MFMAMMCLSKASDLALFFDAAHFSCLVSFVSSFTIWLQEMFVGWPVDYVTVVDINLFSDCNCDISGTEDGSIVCDDNGQCQCKSNVIGLRCDACADAFFGLNTNNTDGNKLNKYLW